MADVRYIVRYDTTNSRPAKDFGSDRNAAVEWAKNRPEKRPDVIQVTETVIYSNWRATE